MIDCLAQETLMARPLKIRVSYFDDAQHISRVLKAVERDVRLSPKLKGQIAQAGTRLYALLLVEVPKEMAELSMAIGKRKRGKKS